MKSLKIALLTGGLLLLSAPAISQNSGGLGSDGDKFVEAVGKSDGDAALQLLQNHPTIVDSKDAKGDTGLIIAIRRGDREWTGFLLNKGADPNLQGANGETPLITAARSRSTTAVEMAGWLLGLGAKVDGTNRKGETPLIIAVQTGNADMVRALLEAGANPDRTDAVAGYSARDYAERDSRARAIQKLINDKKPKGAAAAK
jgi:ankyrin repeat protein